MRVVCEVRVERCYFLCEVYEVCERCVKSEDVLTVYAVTHTHTHTHGV